MSTPPKERQRKLTDDSYHIAVFVCSHIFDNTRPILYISKDDGEYQFLCGDIHEENELPRVVGLGEIVESDESVLDVMDLNDGQDAERKTVNDSWSIIG